nr:XdhC family protein [Streptomyces sp. RTd22]
MQINGSAPLPLGAALAVDADGNAVGSVSGGCVECR